jgi:putative ABC transport system permease protein
MRPRWRKVAHDLFDNVSRTLLVVFSIAVGVFSIGVISGAYVIISEDMSASYSSHRPSNVELRTANFDHEVLAAVRNMRDVQQAEARRVINLRVRVPGSTKWTTLDLMAFDDYQTNEINLLQPVSGQSIPEKREVVLELGALEDLQVQPGEPLEFQLPDGSTTSMPVVGVVQDVATGAGDFLASPYAYVSMSTMPYLDQPELFNRVYLTVHTGRDDLAYIREVGAQVKARLEKDGTPVIRLRFAKEHEHPLAATVNAILGILLALGILILFLSSSLIANTLSALMKINICATSA